MCRGGRRESERGRTTIEETRTHTLGLELIARKSVAPRPGTTTYDKSEMRIDRHLIDLNSSSDVVKQITPTNIETGDDDDVETTMQELLLQVSARKQFRVQ